MRFDCKPPRAANHLSSDNSGRFWPLRKINQLIVWRSFSFRWRWLNMPFLRKTSQANAPSKSAIFFGSHKSIAIIGQ